MDWMDTAAASFNAASRLHLDALDNEIMGWFILLVENVLQSQKKKAKGLFAHAPFFTTPAPGVGSLYHRFCNPLLLCEHNLALILLFIFSLSSVLNTLLSAQNLLTSTLCSPTKGPQKNGATPHRKMVVRQGYTMFIQDISHSGSPLTALFLSLCGFLCRLRLRLGSHLPSPPHPCLGLSWALAGLLL